MIDKDIALSVMREWLKAYENALEKEDVRSNTYLICKRDIEVLKMAIAAVEKKG